MKERGILIVAGEASGEMYAAQLVRQIQRQAQEPVSFFGCAGQAMRQAGVEAIVTVEEISVHGFVEVLSHLEFLFDGFLKILAAAERRKPDLVILVDFPDFNIRLAARLKSLGVHIVYFISPQFWAWRRGRLKVLRKLIDEMICILPFEKRFYDHMGIPAKYVGHPLVEMLEVVCGQEELFLRFEIDPDRPRVALLPGSRKNEIRHNLFPILDTVMRLHSNRPEIQFFLAASTTVGRSFIVRGIEKWQRAGNQVAPVKVIEGYTREIMKYSNMAVVSSGTATLEAALLEVPLICVYKVAPLSWWLGQKLIDVDYYCLVNLILRRGVVPELYQSDFSSRVLEREVLKLLDDRAARQTMIEGVAALRAILSTGHSPMEKAAQIVLSHLETQTGKVESKQVTLEPAVVVSGPPE
ncbi:MAG: lipid-A-disaccharide synthase [Acidobacteriia bacterium]|nr:lipid-A-disaccharide synthase [Terriglobia bacterium]